jgi:hypothetical protein
MSRGVQINCGRLGDAGRVTLAWTRETSHDGPFTFSSSFVSGFWVNMSSNKIIKYYSNYPEIRENFTRQNTVVTNFISSNQGGIIVTVAGRRHAANSMHTLGYITYICISYERVLTEKGQFSPLAKEHKKVGAHFRINHALMLCRYVK